MISFAKGWFSKMSIPPTNALSTAIVFLLDLYPVCYLEFMTKVEQKKKSQIQMPALLVLYSVIIMHSLQV